MFKTDWAEAEGNTPTFVHIASNFELQFSVYHNTLFSS